MKLAKELVVGDKIKSIYNTISTLKRVEKLNGTKLIHVCAIDEEGRVYKDCLNLDEEVKTY